jgi:hypothetical protein
MAGRSQPRGNVERGGRNAHGEVPPNQGYKPPCKGCGLHYMAFWIGERWEGRGFLKVLDFVELSRTTFENLHKIAMYYAYCA